MTAGEDRASECAGARQFVFDPAIREYREPSLEEMLADPIVRALMESDGVDPAEVRALLRSLPGSR